MNRQGLETWAAGRGRPLWLRLRPKGGMTMVELLVSLAVVMLIIGAAATAYLKLLRTYKTQGRLAESYMANLTGLEILRYDIEMAGFGLPANVNGANYTEAVAQGSNNPPPPYDPRALNDSNNNVNGNNYVPRALAHLDNGGANGSDVLAIKSSASNVFNNPAGKKWSMITNAPNFQEPANTNPKVKLWGVSALDPVMDFTNNDYFVILDNNGTLQISSGKWYYTFNASAPDSGYYQNASSIPCPSSAQQVYYIYGLDNNANNSGGLHSMPFNRVDYYLDNSQGIPKSCAPDTYILYRSTVSQANGTLNTSPLVDCVKDFQVAFGLDPGGDPTKTIQWQANLTGLTALQIQQQLREVRVFVLFQEGLGDTSTSPDFRFSGILNLGDQDIAHGLDSSDYPIPPNNFQQLSASALTGAPQLSSFTPSGTDLQYRWKIVEIAVKPMNLMNLTTR